MANRLAQETSPYLLQHANNPVDWYPWGDEAFARARAGDKPIFLSIGYSACHWCHVMEHESFESPAIAELLNAGYVSIKVDREERPDLDQIYMNAVQLLTGRGGWPMSVFLTHEGEPFFGGTYWPPHPKLGMPGFDQILKAVSDAWHQRRPELLSQANKITAHLSATPQEQPRPVPEHVIETAVAKLEQVFDFHNGGFGGAPKFPHPMDLQVLLRYWRVQPKADLERMVALTLDKMARGGIYDQLGGGFHRYSVDEAWLVPHFEKMLYDNALLTTAYLEAYQALGKPQLARVVRETLDYVLREMTDPAGGFYSTQDADSEGEEGKFYVWSQAEVEQLLGTSPAETFCYVYDVSPAGNFEGQNILNMSKTLDQCANILQRDIHELAAELAANRQVLLSARNDRVWPGLDDKVLVSWNGLMIAAMARGGAILQEPRYLQAATRAAEFLTTNMRGPQGELLHSWRQGKARLAAYLDDYACLATALVALYEATFDERWIDEAVSLCEVLLAQFQDQQQGGFYFTADNHEQLITRNKDVMDASVPSGNAMAATALVQLGYLCGRTDFLEAAERTFQSLATVMEQSPTALGQLLLAWDMFRGPTEQFVLIGESTSEELRRVLDTLRQTYLPNTVLACRASAETPAGSSASQQLSPQLSATFAGRKPHDGQPTLYICRGFVCDEPLVGEQAILNKLASLAPQR